MGLLASERAHISERSPFESGVYIWKRLESRMIGWALAYDKSITHTSIHIQPRDKRRDTVHGMLISYHKWTRDIRAFGVAILLEITEKMRSRFTGEIIGRQELSEFAERFNY